MEPAMGCFRYSHNCPFFRYALISFLCVPVFSFFFNMTIGNDRAMRNRVCQSFNSPLIKRLASVEYKGRAKQKCVFEGMRKIPKLIHPAHAQGLIRAFALH